MPLLIETGPDGETYMLDPERAIQIEVTGADTNEDPEAPVIDIFVRNELDEAYLSIYPIEGTFRIIEESETDIDHDLS